MVVAEVLVLHAQGDQDVGAAGLARVRLSVYAPSKQVKRIALPPPRTPAASRRADSRTPSKGCAGTRQPVTHCTSLTIRVWGSALRSARV